MVVVTSAPRFTGSQRQTGAERGRVFMENTCSTCVKVQQTKGTTSPTRGAAALTFYHHTENPSSPSFTHSQQVHWQLQTPPSGAEEEVWGVLTHMIWKVFTVSMGVRSPDPHRPLSMFLSVVCVHCSWLRGVDMLLLNVPHPRGP